MASFLAKRTTGKTKNGRRTSLYTLPKRLMISESVNRRALFRSSTARIDAGIPKTYASTPNAPRVVSDPDSKHLCTREAFSHSDDECGSRRQSNNASVVRARGRYTSGPTLNSAESIASPSPTVGTTTISIETRRHARVTNTRTAVKASGAPIATAY
eukprot:Amastigsp_a511291_5.p2 type:complete len:157 gc:universal Amastigsp_a511291_5:594-124(-)